VANHVVKTTPSDAPGPFQLELFLDGPEALFIRLFVCHFFSVEWVTKAVTRKP
jgi:hypothetical protein